MSRHEVRIDKRGSLPQRLHAARVSACVMSVRRAAEILRVNASTYASWEAGRRAPQKNTVLAAGVAFGVTTDYLFSGWIVNLGDEFAARVERLLYHEARPFDTQAASTRLRRVRSKGYQTAKRAAADNGWVASTYVGHEAGTRSLPLERAIIYSISFGVRPEHVLFDEPAQADLRWMLASGAKLGLKAGRGLEEAFYLPLYDLVNGELVLQGMPLVAPSALFSKLGPYADELKGVVVARANGFDVLLVVHSTAQPAGIDTQVYKGPNGVVVRGPGGARPTRGLQRIGSLAGSLTLRLGEVASN